MNQKSVEIYKSNLFKEDAPMPVEKKQKKVRDDSIQNPFKS